MKDTGRILFFVALIVATARNVSAIYPKETAGQHQTFIVHMNPTKVRIADSINPATWYASFIRDAVVKAGALNDEELAESSILYTYNTVLTGFAAKLSENQVTAIKAMESCMGVYPDKLLKLHTTYTPHFLGLKRGQGLWSESTGYATNVIIGVLDTGVWPEHPSFADHKTQSPVPSKWKGRCEVGKTFNASNCNKKLIGARFFYKGYESDTGPINETVDYKSPRDSNGHGTHTASTAAGNVIPGADVLGYAKGTAAGMAPGARVAVYKVCWSRGCSNSDILAAMDTAVSDGVDVLSISLGGLHGLPFYADSVAVGAFGAVAKGVFVSCSAGNGGPSSSSLSNEAPWIMTVGASSVDRSFPAIVVLGNGRAYRGASLYTGKPLGTKPNLSLVYGDFCSDGSLEPEMVRRKIVVCEQGITGRTEKGQVVAMAGGIGMILLTPDGGGEELIADAHVLPATYVGNKAAKAIRDYLNSNASLSPSGTIVFYGTTYHREEAPILSSFSSRGPNSVSPDILKPDVIAPGLNILAAWPLNMSPSRLPSDKRRTKFNLDSGTSMSCPHVSGLAALLKAAHPDWSPAALKSALITTAYVTNNKGKPITDASLPGSPATPFDMGAGHVNAEKAREPGLVYDIGTEDYVNYLCSLNYSSSEIGVLTKTRVSCPKQIPKPGDLNYPSFSVLFYSSGKASATLSRKVTNVGPHNSTYSVQVVEPLGVKVTVKPKTLVFTKKNQRHLYTVSFGVEKSSASRAYGSITWSSGVYTVRSPVAVIWVDRSLNFRDDDGLVA